MLVSVVQRLLCGLVKSLNKGSDVVAVVEVAVELVGFIGAKVLLF